VKPLCKHCANPDNAVNRPRGLCWSCYYTPGVKDMYPSTSKYARRGPQVDFCGGYKLPPDPTDARPGTPEKQAVLMDRARRGVRLFHPDDARE